MNSFNNLFWASILVIFSHPATVCFGQQSMTSVTMSVIEIDKNNVERPAANMSIYILPKYRGGTKKMTNSQGKVRFEFASAESVVFRIGAGGGQLRLSPISGRFDQETSCIIDRRIKTSVSYTVSGDGWATNSATQGIRSLIQDIRTQSGGRFMTDQTRELVLQIRQEAIEGTQPSTEMTPQQREHVLKVRDSILKEIDDLLAPPWKIGMGYGPDQNTVVVTEITHNGPAHAAGLKVGDRILSVNNAELAEASDSLKHLIGNAYTSEIRIQFERAGQKLVRTITAVR